jgi:hypothetical protein
MRTPFFIIIPLAFLFSSCDKVKDPIVKRNTVAGSKFVNNNNFSRSHYKKVLLEDYTGQTCPNCPTAAKLIKTVLVPAYGDSLIALAVHQGDTYAKPTPTFTNDFRTTAGEEWGKSGSGFGIGFWPSGLVNRKNYGTGLIVPNQAWTTAVPKALKDPMDVKLDVSTQYDTTARALNVSVKGTFMRAYANPTKIIVVIMEDGIVGKQKDGSKDVEDYEFEHMMRGDINGTWGTDFKASAALLGDTVRSNFTNFPLPLTVSGTSGKAPTPLNDRKSAVIAFVYDVSTKSVLQVEKVAIRP